MVRCMLLNANLPKLFWTEATQTATHLINILLSLAIDFKTPNELQNGKPISNSNLSAFGFVAFVHVNNGKL